MAMGRWASLKITKRFSMNWIAFGRLATPPLFPVDVSCVWWETCVFRGARTLVNTLLCAAARLNSGALPCDWLQQSGPDHLAQNRQCCIRGHCESKGPSSIVFKKQLTMAV